jgi:hypothetical protein
MRYCYMPTIRSNIDKHLTRLQIVTGLESNSFWVGDGGVECQSPNPHQTSQLKLAGLMLS